MLFRRVIFVVFLGMSTPFLHAASECIKAKTFLNDYKDTLNYYMTKNYKSATLQLAQKYLQLRVHQLRESIEGASGLYELNCQRLLEQVHKRAFEIQQQSKSEIKSEEVKGKDTKPANQNQQ